MITYKAIFGVLRAFDGKKRIHINNPTEFYSKKDVADLAKHGLKYLPSKTKWLHSQPYQLHHGDCNIEDWNNELTECKCGLFQYIAELEQIVEESA